MRLIITGSCSVASDSYRGSLRADLGTTRGESYPCRGQEDEGFRGNLGQRGKMYPKTGTALLLNALILLHVYLCTVLVRNEN